MNWRWIKTETVLAMHDEQLVTHGGSSGVNLDLLESALQRPQNKDHYGNNSTPAELAAAYTFGIVKNHPFVDGNKRTGFLAAYAFLGKNGLARIFHKLSGSNILNFAEGLRSSVS